MLLLSVLIISTSTFGRYNVAIGLRGGETSGLTIKGFTGNADALEGILGVWHHGCSARLLFEKHTPLKADGLNLYHGEGLHMAFLSGKHNWYKHGRRHCYDYNDGVAIGVDGVLGLEYKHQSVSIAFSLDVKPSETYELLIDSVAGESVIEKRTGEYSFKPVIKLESIVEL